MPKLDLNESELPNVDDEPEGPYFSPRVRTMSGASNVMTSNDDLIPPTEPAEREVSIHLSKYTLLICKYVIIHFANLIDYSGCFCLLAVISVIICNQSSQLPT